MDLREFRGVNKNRHPWETSRVYAVRSILKGSLSASQKVLDLGCGDGFLGRMLFSGTGIKDVVAVDPNLTEKQIDEFTGNGAGISYRRSLPPDTEKFDLILMLDVLEHIENDIGFLRDTVEKRLRNNGRVLITVPAFNCLLSSHDRFLGHYRRYGKSEILKVAVDAGLQSVASGYLYTSLLVPRLASIFAEKLSKKSGTTEGIGSWKGSRAITLAVEMFLRADNRITLFLNKLGVRLPGLTAWVLCEKRL